MLVPLYKSRNKLKHNGFFWTRNGKIIHGDINGAANIGRKHHPELFSKQLIAYNLRLISDPRRRLSNHAKQRFLQFIPTPTIKFCPSNGIPTKELKKKEILKKSNIKPQRHQMSPKRFLAMPRVAYV
ncbi:MAG: hypothetical protein GF311_26410 [Candidatus Lokiarchaeota archaeon]|nr:hypothetical protein [Candidatus Lokiarchaeota archaeon]